MKLVVKATLKLWILPFPVADPSPPPQHSPIFGHFASSQTVAKPDFRNPDFTL